MDVGTFLLMPGLSHARELHWDDLLPGTLPKPVWRVAAVVVDWLIRQAGHTSLFLAPEPRAAAA